MFISVQQRHPWHNGMTNVTISAKIVDDANKTGVYVVVLYFDVKNDIIPSKQV